MQQGELGFLHVRFEVPIRHVGGDGQELNVPSL